MTSDVEFVVETPLGGNLKKLRKDRGLTQDAACEKLRLYARDPRTGIPRTIARETWSRIENGQPNVDTWILVAMASMFGTTVDALLREDQQVSSAPAGEGMESPSITRGDMMILGDQIAALPGWLQILLMRLFRASVAETTAMLRTSSVVQPGEAWLLRALQRLPESRYRAFQSWLDAQEAQLASANELTG